MKKIEQRSRTFKTLLKILLAFCLYALILEGGTRLLLSINIVHDWITDSYLCDTVWRWAWIDRHQKGDAADYTFTYSFDRYDAARGWALKANISNVVCFGNKIINTNSKGIRGKTEYAYAGNKDKLRILILGDSYTFGEEVSDTETYPYCLQQMLPDAEVINLGVRGYGHDQMLIYLKEEGIKYKPDIVILGVITGDAGRNMLKFRDYAKPKFKLLNNGLKLDNVPVPDPETTLKNELWKSRFIGLLDILYSLILRKTGIYEAEKEKLTNAILEEMVITANSIEAKPVFVYLENIRSKEADRGMTREEQNFFDACKNMKVDCVFLRSLFQSARRQGIRIKEDGHFDIKTHRIVARGIKDYLVKSGLAVKRRHHTR
ncbi:MAG: SGNH/GDSL hydrolase family protein [bacterium]